MILVNQPAPFEIFWAAAEHYNLIKIIAATNKYANQNGQNIENTKEVVLSFLGINFTMAVNRLP